MVQRAYPSGGDKHCGPAMMPDVLSTLYCQQQQSTHTRLRARRVFTFGMRYSGVNVSSVCFYPPTLNTTKLPFILTFNFSDFCISKQEKLLSASDIIPIFLTSFPSFQKFTTTECSSLDRMRQMGPLVSKKQGLI